MTEAKIIIDYYGDVIANLIAKTNPHPSGVAIDLVAILIRYLDSHTFLCRSSLHREFIEKRLAKYKEEIEKDKQTNNLQYVYRLSIRNAEIKLNLDWGYRNKKALFLWKQNRKRVYISKEQLDKARQEKMLRKESLKNIETLEKFVKPKRIRIR